MCIATITVQYKIYNNANELNPTEVFGCVLISRISTDKIVVEYTRLYHIPSDSHHFLSGIYSVTERCLDTNINLTSLYQSDADSALTLFN